MKNHRIEARLVKFQVQDNCNACFEIEITKTAVAYLMAMRLKWLKIELKPLDGNTKLPSLGDFVGKMLEVRIPRAPKTQARFGVEFEVTRDVITALTTIRDMEPPTVLVCETQKQIEFDDLAEEAFECEDLPGLEGGNGKTEDWPGTADTATEAPKRRGRPRKSAR